MTPDYESKRQAVAKLLAREEDCSPAWFDKHFLRVAEELLAALGIHPPAPPTLGERVAAKFAWTADGWPSNGLTKSALIKAIDDAAAEGREK